VPMVKLVGPGMVRQNKVFRVGEGGGHQAIQPGVAGRDTTPAHFFPSLIESSEHRC